MEEKQGFAKYKKLFILLGLLSIGIVCYVALDKLENQTILDSYREIDLSSSKLIELDDDRVSLTIPVDYVLEATQEQLNLTAEKSGYESVTLNDDGTATYILTRQQHAEMVEGLAKGLRSALQSMIGTTDYQDIAAIEANDDFTEFTVTLGNTGSNYSPAKTIIEFRTISNAYHAFAGDGSHDITTLIYDVNGNLIYSES